MLNNIIHPQLLRRMSYFKECAFHGRKISESVDIFLWDINVNKIQPQSQILLNIKRYLDNKVSRQYWFLFSLFYLSMNLGVFFHKGHPRSKSNSIT